MPEEIEIEYKNLLTKEEFQRLKSRFSLTEGDFSLQKNHYFDTHSNELKELHCALRIREKKGRFEFTLKQPAEEGLLETNQPITEEETRSMLQQGLIPEGEVADALQNLGINKNNLRHFGTLSTSRAETGYKDGLMVLDYSFYLNNEDYELEYEVKESNKGREIFYNFLESMDIPTRPADNKIKRFLKAANSN
ncbi:CYTH domain-containing protein [Bacillus sp. SCS-153A]|uniref:CYTH domain-containing protein n=1 Tax=Rossellomorea sedimentorum TaxID=3115294 RepID=UPI003905CBAD